MLRDWMRDEDRSSCDENKSYMKESAGCNDSFCFVLFCFQDIVPAVLVGCGKQAEKC